MSGELHARNADLERREASARALHRVSVAIAALADLDEILQAIVDQARERLGADVAVLLTYRPDGEAYVAAGSGPDHGIDPAGGFQGSGAARFVRPDLAIVRLEAPLQRAGETIGLLMVGSRFERGFEVDEVEMLSSLANQAAIATENARLQARLRELAVVAERERIAREMHDGLAQVLGYVNTKSQAVEELLVAGRTDEARGLLTELAAAARSIYVDVREAILGLRSPVVPGIGLVAAVEEYSARFAEASKLVVRVEASGRRATARSRARRGGTGLPDHPGGPDQRPKALGGEAGRGRLLRGRRPPRGGHRRRWPRDRARSLLADRPHYGLGAMRERADSIDATVDWTNPAEGGCRVRLAVAAGPPVPVGSGAA